MLVVPRKLLLATSHATGLCHPPPVQKSADPWARGHRNDHLEIEMETLSSPEPIELLDNTSSTLC